MYLKGNVSWLNSQVIIDITKPSGYSFIAISLCIDLWSKWDHTKSSPNGKNMRPFLLLITFLSFAFTRINNKYNTTWLAFRYSFLVLLELYKLNLNVFTKSVQSISAPLVLSLHVINDWYSLQLLRIKYGTTTWDWDFRPFK